MALTSRKTKNVTISVRMHAAQRDLIDRAAQARGVTRSEFILEAACSEAEYVLGVQPRLVLGQEDFDAFVAVLDAPPQPSEALRKLMRLRPPWV